RPQRLVRRGEGDGPRGVRVDDAGDVGAGAHQLGVDRILDVPAPRALEHLALPGDEKHLLRPDLLEAVRRSLHPDAATVRVARGDVAPDEVALILEAEDAAAECNLLAELVAHEASIRRAGSRRPFAAVS